MESAHAEGPSFREIAFATGYEPEHTTSEQREEIRRQRETIQRPTLVTRTLPVRELFGFAPVSRGPMPDTVNTADLFGYGATGESQPTPEDVFRAEAKR